MPQCRRDQTKFAHFLLSIVIVESLLVILVMTWEHRTAETIADQKRQQRRLKRDKRQMDAESAKSFPKNHHDNMNIMEPAGLQNVPGGKEKPHLLSRTEPVSLLRKLVSRKKKHNLWSADERSWDYSVKDSGENIRTEKAARKLEPKQGQGDSHQRVNGGRLVYFLNELQDRAELNPEALVKPLDINPLNPVERDEWQPNQYGSMSDDF